MGGSPGTGGDWVFALIIIGVIVGVILLTAVIIIVAVAASRKSKKRLLQQQQLNKNTKTENVVVKDGVRYTENNNTFRADGKEAVTHRVGDVTLERGVTYTARAGGKLLPGKYTILSGLEGVSAFNMRIGGLVREIKHGSDIVIGEGDEICAVSHPAVLR